MIDPAAPRPEGQLMTPVRGDSASAATQNHPRSLDRGNIPFFRW
ncbi:unnamed protein product [Nippostrongylus brasiliensis]|uniref:Uncharacterized protein n=1 Tax=Nippostrongylus brasiliensis TaxID=27835 RepID=A0A0N4XMG1_NIPBR|nr:unnamed protein product [Nippostrongylus brasiliensis]